MTEESRVTISLRACHKTTTCETYNGRELHTLDSVALQEFFRNPSLYMHVNRTGNKPPQMNVGILFAVVQMDRKGDKRGCV